MYQLLLLVLLVASSEVSALNRKSRSPTDNAEDYSYQDVDDDFEPEPPRWTDPERMERIVHAEPINSNVSQVRVTARLHYVTKPCDVGHRIV